MPAPDRAAAPLAAISFLTTLPLGPRDDPRGAALLRAAPFFPLVGAALGAVVGAAAVGLVGLLPPLLAGLVAVVLEIVLTGALHVDGLADSADGLGGRDRGQSLAIMRDHSLGAYGASALSLDLAAKAAALGTLAEAEAVGAIVAAMALSRAAPLPLARLLPYARVSGTGSLLVGRLGTRAAVAGVVLALAVALLAAGAEGLALLVCGAALVAALGFLAHRRIRGVTGDVLGAAVELCATTSLVLAVALMA